MLRSRLLTVIKTQWAGGYPIIVSFFGAIAVWLWVMLVFTIAVKVIDLVAWPPPFDILVALLELTAIVPLYCGAIALLSVGAWRSASRHRREGKRLATSAFVQVSVVLIVVGSVRAFLYEVLPLYGAGLSNFVKHFH